MTTEQTMRLREPADLLATIPYLVGFHPSDSMVVLGIRGRRLVITARDDLAAGPVHPDHVINRVEHLLDVLLRQHCTGVLLVGFGPPDRVDPMVIGLQVAFDQVGLHVQEALRVADGRYWSYLCANPRCCPPEGTPYDPSATAVAAEWTLAGRVARRNREEYEAQLAPVTGAAREAMTEATERAHDRLIELLRSVEDEDAAAAAIVTAGRVALAGAVERFLADRRLSDDELAWLTVLLMDDQVRDAAWARLRRAADSIELHRALWMDVLRRCESDLAGPPALLFAYSAWRCGDGAMARIGIERAIDQNPDSVLAWAMLRALSQGASPSLFDDEDEFTVTPRRVRRRRRRSSSPRAGSRRG